MSVDLYSPKMEWITNKSVNVKDDASVPLLHRIRDQLCEDCEKDKQLQHKYFGEVLPVTITVSELVGTELSAHTASFLGDYDLHQSTKPDADTTTYRCIVYDNLEQSFDYFDFTDDTSISKCIKCTCTKGYPKTTPYTALHSFDITIMLKDSIWEEMPMQRHEDYIISNIKSYITEHSTIGTHVVTMTGDAHPILTLSDSNEEIAVYMSSSIQSKEYKISFVYSVQKPKSNKYMLLMWFKRCLRYIITELFNMFEEKRTNDHNQYVAHAAINDRSEIGMMGGTKRSRTKHRPTNPKRRRPRTKKRNNRS